MQPLEAAIYLAVDDAGFPGLTGGEIFSRLPQDTAQGRIERVEVSRLINGLLKRGKLHAHSHEGQQRYMAAHAKQEALKPPPSTKKPKGVQASSTEGSIRDACQMIRESGIAAAVAATPIKPVKAKPANDTIRAAYAEAFNHGMIHACACMAGVTDMPREQAVEHYWRISEAAKERAA